MVILHVECFHDNTYVLQKNLVIVFFHMVQDGLDICSDDAIVTGLVTEQVLGDCFSDLKVDDLLNVAFPEIGLKFWEWSSLSWRN